MRPHRLHAHLPWSNHADHLEAILELGLAPEFAFKGPDLDSLDESLVAYTARRLSATGRRPTVHAPFFDLSPGAMEPRVRQVTRERLSQSLETAGKLGAQVMVVHPGYDRWRYPHLADNWIAQAADFFPPLLALAERVDCRLALENIYEETPATLLSLVDRLASPWFGHCFDIGHWRLFGTTGQNDWLAAIAPRLLHLHLHDNLGQADDHLPVGEGTIDFAPLCRLLQTFAKPPTMTLEAHSPDDLRRSLVNFTTLTTKGVEP